jgi:hypothetical protein
MGCKEMATYYCVFCDNKVDNEKVCFNCNEYKGVVTESEYKELQKEWGVAK